VAGGQAGLVAYSKRGAGQSPRAVRSSAGNVTTEVGHLGAVVAGEHLHIEPGKQVPQALDHGQ